MLFIWAINVVLPDQPMQGQGNCGVGYVDKVESAPFEYDGDQIITKVFVKSSTNCFNLSVNNPSDGCYTASGLGTTHVKVSRTGEASNECQEISHVEFYAGIINTPTGTPTSTVTPTATQTATQVEENTPTATVTPTATDPPTETPTVTGTPGEEITPTPSEAVTPTYTETSPPNKQRTKTPQPILPATGEAEDRAESIAIPIGFVGMVLAGFIIAAYVRRMKGDES
jgi:hypothetical protein